MEDGIPLLVITFDNKITQCEIPFFRGAVLSKVSRKLDVFHNHEEDALKYRYPLIQYKRIRQKAAIVCVGQGTQAIGAFFGSCDFNMQIGNRKELFSVNGVKGDRHHIGVTEETKRYTIRKWLAFNQDNYSIFANISTVEEKIEMLEHIIIGNILSMCKGLEITIEDEIRCEIQEVFSFNEYLYKGTQMIGLDLEFTANVNLPDYIGLGKGVSLGYGMVKQMNNIKS